ncbi:thrombomodulin-like [Alosa pseudoharengus]|uniref:thrombomodulin-like n=1 Tax=Alosa pseudoharengus TaxID=34774 RepID=UPI003F8B9687
MELFRFSVRLTFFIALFFSSDGVPRNCTCNNKVCKAAFKFPSDFQTSKQLCQDMGGQLITVPSKAASDLVRDLLMDMHGDFWIGLRLPDLQCTNDMSPLKGYIWTSGSQTTEFTNWGSKETVCAPSCVSISADLTWTEKLCKVQSDGLLCENVPEDVCFDFKLEEPEYSIFYYDTNGCLSGACEHHCTGVDHGFKCSCFPNFVINRKDQRRCVIKCTSESCAADCVGTSCSCPDGYILDQENVCVDIDECEQGSCHDAHCFNTLGDYECSCRNGFRLVGKDRCVKSDESDLLPNIDLLTNSVIHTASVNYTTGHASAGAPGKFIGIILLILVGIVAVMFFVRYWKQKMDEPNISSTSDRDRMQSSYS